MEVTNWTRITDLFFPALLAAALFASAVAFRVLGPVAGIKSWYVLIGLLFAVTVYGYTQTTTDRSFARGAGWADANLCEGVLGLVLVSVAAVAGARVSGVVDPSLVRTGVVVLALPVGYLLLALQMHAETDTTWLLTQIVALFVLDPVTKYLSTSFYFGRGDIAKHVYFSELVAESGSWRAIPETTLYSHFPGLQTLVGSVSVLTGLPPYDTLVITGIVTYVAVVCVSYLLAELLFRDRQFPVYVALSLTVLAPIHRYSVYFFPQSLAVALGLVLLLAGVRYRTVTAAPYRRHALLTLPIVVALWFTHHFTVVLFVPIIVGLLAGPPLLDRLFGRPATVRPWALPLAAWAGGSLTYWVATGVFLPSLVEALGEVFGIAQVGSDSTGGAKIVALGTAVPEPSVLEALRSLFSAGGFYNSMLICLFSLGALLIFRDVDRYLRAGSVVAVGLLGAGLMIRTPLDVHGLVRTQLPLSLFAAFVIAAALTRLFPIPDGSVRRAAPAVLAVVLLATAGPAVAADDLYGLHSGPDLWETRTVPETQKEFTATEMASFRQSTTFSERYGGSVGTDWNSQLGRTRYGADSTSVDASDGRIRTEQDLLLYRQRWSDHSVRLVPERLSFVTLLITDEWRGDMVRTENKVYTTGEVGMLADEANSTRLVEG
ncbi:hypothetical protein [Haloarcula onubensis]|uniref:DUF2206 domain-containing protein n=1 Tax=Haloarcula onubensis TaxID=2950539 RepID=A0ABU2FW29_9EURY|nr:hypothetical protein [Halomicroarcula sp. S3CR25-11]MDS0284659.1 hypothetical protein [Halomicroarcula sp. S3CR25-11]